jgi:hypothetical protein
MPRDSRDGLLPADGPNSKGGRFIALAALAILLPVVSLGSLVALAEQPGRPKTTGYPSLEAVPPNKPAMTADELVKLKADLSAKRDRQVPKGKSGTGTGQPVKP